LASMLRLAFIAQLVSLTALLWVMGLSSISLAEAESLHIVRPRMDRHAARRVARILARRPQCRDHRDNDRDGLVDYPNDPGCKSRRDRKEAPNPTPTPTPNPNSPGATVDLGVGASLHGVRPLPSDNPWNTDISQLPVDTNSTALIASIGLTTGLHPDFGTVWEGAPIGIPYVVVSGEQAKSAVTFEYGDESDSGPYPIPADPPIEGGANATGDRHILMLDRDNWLLYELFYARRSNGRWSAGSGAIFDLASNDLRPAGWTSADAAGLPIFPGLVRYDEVMEQGEILHALRFTAQRTRRAYLPPATHYASSDTSADLPPMGMRVRLKASFNTSTFPAPVQVILRAMQRYGMLLADNGSNWFVSGAPDARWDDDVLATLRQVRGQDFEVVQMNGLIVGE